MNKQEFLAELRRRLTGLPQNETEERLTFYSEMIDDRIEEGFSEDKAISEIGDIDEIISQAKQDHPLSNIAKPKRRLKVWEIILLAVGSPIWLSLLIAASAVVIAIYVSLWSVIVSLWSAVVALGGGALGGIIGGVAHIAENFYLNGIALIGASFICAGFAILLFYICKLLTKGTVWLTKQFFLWIKNRLKRKEKIS